MLLFNLLFIFKFSLYCLPTFQSYWIWYVNESFLVVIICDMEYHIAHHLMLLNFVIDTISALHNLLYNNNTLLKDFFIYPSHLPCYGNADPEPNQQSTHILEVINTPSVTHYDTYSHSHTNISVFLSFLRPAIFFYYFITFITFSSDNWCIKRNINYNLFFQMDIVIEKPKNADICMIWGNEERH